MDVRADDELTVRQAAQRVGRADETIRRWIWSGRLPARKLGNIYYLRTTDLDVVSSGGHIPPQRQGPAPALSMTEWLDEVARWKASLSATERVTTIDLLREGREYLEERAERGSR